MLSNDRKRSVRHRLLPENPADETGNPLSLQSFVTFVPFKVNCVAREGSLGYVVRNSG